MATIMDLGLLEHFTPVFVFIFIWAVTYGILTVTKILGDSKNLNGIIAFCIGLFIAFSTKPRVIISGIIPWFVLMFVFFMFVLIGMRFVFGEGQGDEMMLNMLGGKTGAGWWIFAVGLTIVIVIAASELSPAITPGASNTTTTSGTSSSNAETGPGSTDTGDWRSNVLNTMFHPKMVGTLVFLLIALFTI
ncbi:hypothetical protein KY320_01615, partial [Candidatus Woesearchaeota archaeon]|nr:hypothetical protein [Candidatus Woesearchaeota archaeon]